MPPLSSADPSSPPSKLDPRLAAVMRLPAPVVDDMLARDRPSGVRFAGAAAGIAVRVGSPPLPETRALHGVRRDADDSLMASVLIRFRGDAARLSAFGAQVNRVIGDIATVEASIGVLRAIEQDPDVVFIELAQPLIAELNTSGPDMGVDRLHHGQPPLEGQDVMVGVIDLDGIDLRHLDFSRAGSSPPQTRIRHLWDQTQEDPPRPGGGGRRPEPWSYGVEYTGADIDRDAALEVPYRFVPARPTGAHGTHVAGIAAGNGRVLGGKYTGVAPGADLLFVNLRSDPGQTVGSTTSLVDALLYAFQRAGSAACVVNISLGTQSGPRDGTGLTERAIDEMLREPGRAVVIAAGNDRERRRHKQGAVPAQGTEEIALEVPDTVRPETIEIWYPGPARLDLSVVTPRGARIGPVPPGAQESLTSGTTRVTIVSMVKDARNGDNVIQILLQPEASTALLTGTWKLVLSGRADATAAPEGAYHATITGASGAVWAAPSARSMLTSPGTAEGAITVGNCLHGYSHDIAGSSSPGPTRDGRRKPDLAAPGTGIWAASTPTVEHEGPYRQLSGTSMAAPQVAGLVALLYQRHGRIAGEALKKMLRERADRTGLDGDWDPDFGWGRARAP